MNQLLSKAALAAAAVGSALALALTACGSTSSPGAAGSPSTAAPSPTRSADASGTAVTTVAQACMAIQTAVPGFQSAYQAATTVHGKALAVADFTGTVAAVVYDLSKSAVEGTATDDASRIIGDDAQALVDTLKVVARDLSRGDEAGAAAALSGQLQSAVDKLKADCGS